MKKRLLTGWALCAVVASAGAQGTLFFQNSLTSSIYINGTGIGHRATSATIGAQTGNGSTGVIDVGLVWGTSADDVNTLQGIEGIGTAAGILGGVPAIADNYGLTGTSPGDTVFVQIFCWDSSFGDSLDGMNACLAAGGLFAAASGTPGVYGSIGAPLSFTLGQPQGPGTVIFGTTPGVFGPSEGLFNNMELVASPEPATMTVAGMGIVALLFFRRRK